MRYYAAVPGRTIRHPYGLKAEVDIQPRNIGPHSSATQTIRIQADKTCESIRAWCRASTANGWVTFDTMPRFDRFFDPREGVRSLWRKRNLPPVLCEIELAAGTVVPQQDPETVTVQLEARDDSDRPVFGVPNAVINLIVK